MSEINSGAQGRRRDRKNISHQEQSPVQRWLNLGSSDEPEERRGEIVLLAARWVLIVVGIVLTLDAPASLIQLQFGVGVLIAIAAVNFVLHTNLVTNQAASKTVLCWSSAGDVVAITSIIAMTGGFSSYVFVFFYPAILAYSVALPFRVTAGLTAAVVGLYAAVVLTVSAAALHADSQAVASTLVARLFTFIAVMAAANMYRWVEERRLEDESPNASPVPSSDQRGIADRPAIDTGFAF